MSRHETKTGIVVPFPEHSGPACLVLIYGRELGRRWMLETPAVVIGRGEQCGLVLDMDNVSRRHCEIKVAADGSHLVEDLNSTNGTFVNDEELRGPRTLRGGDQIRIGGAILKYLDGSNLESLFHEEIYRMTIVDGLTQTFNKRYLLEFLEREMSRCHRYGRALSLMMFDVDHFKRVNDTFGHIAGDYVLREISGVVRQMVRKEECFARYGGEEFALVMPEMEREKVLVFAEKIRASVEACPLRFEDRPMPITISIGVAQMTAGVTEPLQFIAAADEKLYEAKRTGRNRVVG